MRDVPKKNYIKLFIIIILTITLTIILARIYQINNNKTSIMYNTISEIKENDLADYVNEKGFAIIYLGDKKSQEYQQFEKELSNEIKENNLKENFVYLNIPDLSDEFKAKFAQSYNRNIDLSRNPIIVVFSDSQITDIIYINVNDYNINTLIQLEDAE